MSVQKQDNSIRQKLQEIKEVPTEASFNAVEIWQKIEIDLQPKQRRRNYLLWLSIAAMSLLMLVTAVIYNNGNKKQVPPAISFEPENKKNVLSEIQHDKNSKTIKAHLTTRKNKEQINSKSTVDVVDETKVQDSMITRTSMVELPITLSITPEVIAATNQPVSSQAKKPKLKVIHINDIYKPIPEDIVKAETKRQSSEEVTVEPEPVITTPSKLFWKIKAPQKVAITLNDNQ